MAHGEHPVDRERATQAADLPHPCVVIKGATETDICAMPGCGRPYADEIHVTATQQASVEESMPRERGS